MTQEQNDKQKNEKENGKIVIPRSLDPGWATVLAAALALIGTLAVLIIGRSEGRSPSQAATVEQAAAANQVLASETSAPTATNDPGSVPTVTLMEGLSPVQDELLSTAWKGALDLASKLPLIIRDSFDVNDYNWPEWNETGAKGVVCDVAIEDSGFKSIVQTTEASGPGYCLTFAPRPVGNNFLLSFDAALTHNRNAKILYYYRYVDDSNYYYVLMNPQVQLVTIGMVKDGLNIPFFERYTPKINKTGKNKITTLMLENNQILFINDEAIGSITYPSGIATGNVRLGLELHEADEIEELVIDNFELRGDM